MNVELTDKEAREIYVQRYYDSRGKKKYAPMVFFGVALLIFSLFYVPGREWLITGLAMLPLALALYIVFKTSRSARKHAEMQMMVK